MGIFGIGHHREEEDFFLYPLLNPINCGAYIIRRLLPLWIVVVYKKKPAINYMTVCKHEVESDLGKNMGAVNKDKVELFWQLRQQQRGRLNNRLSRQ